MKRVIASIVGTVAGVVALLSFKTTAPQTSAGPLPSAGLAGTAGTTSGAAASSPTPAPSSASSSGTSSSSTPAATTGKKYLGQAITTRYGVIQVEVSVSASTITDVQFVQLQAFDGRSQEINSYAAPVLLKETLAAQSAQIDAVSGASYTSQGYEQSLQSALDAAGIK